MYISEIEKQNIRIEGFAEGYKAALQWLAIAEAQKKEAINATPSPEAK